MTDMEAADKLTRAKIAVSHPITGNPFFGYMVFHLRTREEKGVPTMGVNEHFEMIYNPEFINKLPDDEMRFILCHEIMHLALEHTKKERIGARDAMVMNEFGQPYMLWNIAGDYVINQMLLDANIGKMPSKVLHDDKYKNMLTEEVYDELFKQMKKNPKMKFYTFMGETLKPAGGDDGQAPSQAGQNGQQNPGMGGSGNQPTPTDWKQVMNEALTNAKLQGKTPLGAERLLEQLNFPKKNWKALLSRYIQNTIPYDYTYSRPNKRRSEGDIIFPSVKKDGITVVCGIDTSGSIGSEELSKFYNQMCGIRDSCQNMNLWVMTCDSEVHECEKIKKHQNILKKIKFKGGGGTELHMIFEKIKEKKIQPNAVAILTDGYTDLDAIKKQKYPVIWVLTRNHADMKGVYGQKIEMG